MVGILLGKFFSRASEVSVFRAMGASRPAIFAQHVIECEVIGVLGGAVGVALALGFLELINRLFESSFPFALDTYSLAASVLLSLIAGLIAGLYPAWRICSIPPAEFLREQ